MKFYKTAEVAKIIGVHPNTVRLYEELALIPRPQRAPNGYRIFTDLHLDVFRLARLAFQIVVLQNGLRKKIVQMVKVAAAGDYDAALALTDEYLRQIKTEQKNAREAITIVGQILAGSPPSTTVQLKRSETAKLLEISSDTLRNWEMNGLLRVKRRENGYRVYSAEDIDRLKIIRCLRCANYSLEAILRMLSALSVDPQTDLEEALDAVEAETDEDIISASDKLLTSLALAAENARAMQKMLRQMKNKY